MPEGDTVFRTAAALREALVGKTLTRCDVRVPRYATVDLSGSPVDEVISRGKHLFIRVGAASIHSHLKMDGSWRLSTRGVPAHKIRILLRAAEVTAAGIDLGVLEILDRDTDQDVVAHLGPDLLGEGWDPQRAAANLAVAAAADHGFDSPQTDYAITVAKATLGRVVPAVVTAAHQLHGAIGVTIEHRLWLVTMRARSWIGEFGDTAHYARRLGRMALETGDSWDLIVGNVTHHPAG